MTEGGPLSEPEFSALGKGFVLFCQIASRVPGRKYPKLREKKGLSGLPSIAFLDQTGEVLVRVSSKLRTVKGFAEIGRRAREYVRLRTLSKSGDSPASARFLKMQLEERQVDLATAQKRYESLSVLRDSEDPADRKLHRSLRLPILHLRITTEMRTRGQKKRHTLGPKFWSMWKDGPNPGPHVSRGFWYAILEWAERDRKVKIFAEALEAFRAALHITDPTATWVPGMLARYEKTLKALMGD